ncbi:surface antigen-domain-containing protein [Chytridium lagenaria]|nr:surface antigen-domain-containing protein [Chytridium lagenaria]
MDVIIAVEEMSRVYARTATSIGTNEGDVMMSINLRNAFGGGEFLEGNASYGMESNIAGTKTNMVPNETGTSFNFLLNQPIDADPDKRLELKAFKTSRNQTLYSSHVENVLGFAAGVKLMQRPFVVQDVFYSGSLRNVQDFTREASWSARRDGGNTFKSAISHSLTVDTRDDNLLPSKGYYIRTLEELAGLGGDVKHVKAEMEGHIHRSFWDDFILSLSGRTGAMHGLGPAPSRINDRFSLGGPSSVRGFAQNGLGPKDRVDCWGRPLFCRGLSSSLLFRT